MNTIALYIDYPGRYQSGVNYAASTIDCEFTQVSGSTTSGFSQGEVYACKLSDLWSTISELLKGKSRYRIITNNARLCALNSDLLSAIEHGAYSYRNTTQKWLNIDTGEEERCQSIISVFSPKVCIACLDHVKSKSEVTILDTANYGFVWHEQVKVCEDYSGEEQGSGLLQCKILSDEPACGIALLSTMIGRYNLYCSRYKLGKPAMTLASQGAESHRWIKGHHRWKQTRCPKALQLEIAGYHGGVAMPFGYGRYDGECHMYDISSFYPSLGVSSHVPTEHIQTNEHPTTGDLEYCVKEFYCIARVDIEADGYYPLRSGFETVYPRGCTVTAVLHQAELERALSHHQIRRVHLLACYGRGRPFAANMRHLLSVRQAAEKAEDKFLCLTAKGIANAWWGKVGSRLSCWTDDEAVFGIPELETWVSVSGATGQISSYRSVFGRVQRKREDLIPAEGSIAAAGALTAYGRERLWALVDLCGKENVLYVSTDSIIVNRQGKRRVDPYVYRGGYSPGSIREIQESDSCTIAGIGLYSIGRRYARQGYSRETDGSEAVEWTELPSTYEEVMAKADIVPFVHQFTKQGELYGDT